MNPDGQLDMQQLLAAAQQMQEQLMNAQQELADAEVAGTAGGGLVTARVNGQGELVDLTIAPDAIDVNDLDETAQTIADLVLAAVRDAYARAGDLQQEKMGPFASALGGGGGGRGGGRRKDLDIPDAEDMASPGQTEITGMDLIQRELGGKIIGEIED